MSTWGPPTPRFGNHSYNTINEAQCRGREQEDTAFIFVGQRFGYCLLSVNTSTDTETSSSFNDCDGKCQHIHICLCSAVCLRCHWMFFLQTFSVKKKKNPGSRISSVVRRGHSVCLIERVVGLTTGSESTLSFHMEKVSYWRTHLVSLIPFFLL